MFGSVRYWKNIAHSLRLRISPIGFCATPSSFASSSVMIGLLPPKDMPQVGS
ncbi:MAG: hypothetical protein FWB78_10325 [Treponema sp.]|nr:hypothetical protein [Treponema sp.]